VLDETFEQGHSPATVVTIYRGTLEAHESAAKAKGDKSATLYASVTAIDSVGLSTTVTEPMVMAWTPPKVGRLLINGQPMEVAWRLDPTHGLLSPLLAPFSLLLSLYLLTYYGFTSV
jgi:hypothetical protein